MTTISMIPMPGGTVSAQVLDTDHYDALDSALSHVLATKIARDSISQLMDGLPVWSVYVQTFTLLNHIGAPIREHLELCDGAVELADSFLASFSTASLVFDASLLQTFQNAEPGSDQFNIRLIELVARSIHCIAVSIDKNATKTHKGDIAAVTNYQNPVKKSKFGLEPVIFEPDANMFVHRMFTAHKQYPFGAADMAGYWLEDRILGGVVLFDRGESGKEAKSVWLLSNRRDWTRRVWKLLDWQFDAMISFFLHGADPSDTLHDASPVEHVPLPGPDEPSPQRMLKFPFFCDIDNPYRHDDWDALAYHNIYRDLWERYIPPEKPERCVLNSFDYPDHGARMRKIMKMAAEGPKYRVTHLGPLPPADEPLENLSEEARRAGGLDMYHFRVEEVSGNPVVDVDGQDDNGEVGDTSAAPLVDADEQQDDAEGRNATASPTVAADEYQDNGEGGVSKVAPVVAADEHQDNAEGGKETNTL